MRQFLAELRKGLLTNAGCAQLVHVRLQILIADDPIPISIDKREITLQIYAVFLVAEGRLDSAGELGKGDNVIGVVLALELALDGVGGEVVAVVIWEEFERLGKLSG